MHKFYPLLEAFLLNGFKNEDYPLIVIDTQLYEIINEILPPPHNEFISKECETRGLYTLYKPSFYNMLVQNEEWTNSQRRREATRQATEKYISEQEIKIEKIKKALKVDNLADLDPAILRLAQQLIDT